MSACDTRGVQTDPDDWSAVGMEDTPEQAGASTLTDDVCDVLRIVMSESDRDLEERLRLAGVVLDLAELAGLTSEGVRAWPASTC